MLGKWPGWPELGTAQPLFFTFFVLFSLTITVGIWSRPQSSLLLLTSLLILLIIYLLILLLKLLLIYVSQLSRNHYMLLFLVAEQLYRWPCLSVCLPVRVSQIFVPKFCPRFLNEALQLLLNLGLFCLQCSCFTW